MEKGGKTERSEGRARYDQISHITGMKNQQTELTVEKGGKTERSERGACYDQISHITGMSLLAK